MSTRHQHIFPPSPFGHFYGLPQQPHHHHYRPHHHQQHQFLAGGFHDPLSVAALASSSSSLPYARSPQDDVFFRQSDLSPSVYHPSPLHSRPGPPLDRMTYMQSDEELAQLQKLSNEYQPEVTGPLVGERQRSSALTTEYANSDPVFQAKTRSLPQKYSHYRTCRGDGHCGWRAIAFSYFEALVRVGDASKFDREIARLGSMRNLLNDIGFQEMLYEDFEEEMLELLRKTGSALATGDAENVLMTNFNDENVAMSIITYIKLLTSAYLQHHPEDYQNFLLGQDIRQYCQHNIEPSVCEIEHVGISALVNVLVKPIGIAAEITYLDRTPGEEANLYRFDPLDQHGNPLHDPTTIRVLYRPGHYDILYKPEDIPRPVQPMTSPVYVALANHTGGNPQIDDLGGMPGWMSMIPGMSTAGGSQMGWGYSSSDFSPTPAMPTAPQSRKVVPPPAYAPLPVQPPQMTQQPMPPNSSQDFLSSPVYSEAPSITLPLNPGPPTIERSEPFRPSVWQLEPDFANGPSHTLPFQTSIFRNSHYNTAHFLNPDFQPEEWSPDTEYAAGSEKSRGRKNS